MGPEEDGSMTLDGKPLAEFLPAPGEPKEVTREETKEEEAVPEPPKKVLGTVPALPKDELRRRSRRRN